MTNNPQQMSLFTEEMRDAVVDRLVETAHVPERMSSMHPMAIMLQAAVPLWIAQLLAYPSQEAMWNEIQAWVTEAQATLNEVGEGVLYRTKKDDSARGFNAIAQSLAGLAFVPGGVTFSNIHWEAHNGEAPLSNPGHMGIWE